MPETEIAASGSAAIVVDHGGDAAQPHAGFLVVDGKTLAADFFEFLEQIARPHDRFFGQPRHAVMADDAR